MMDHQPEPAGSNENLFFGRWLRRRRRSLDLTQDALAQCVGCVADTVRKIELGMRRPSRAMAERLAQCLSIPLEQHAAFLAAARAGRVPPDPAVAPIPAPPGTLAPADAPAAVSTTPRRGYLPSPLTSFIGREWEIATVDTRLRAPEVRLVTLTGAGGIGKTRLALQIAGGLRDAFPDGVWFVNLAPLRDPTLVIPTIAQALRVREQPGISIVETLRAALGKRRLLVVLDNFEQVDAAAPALAGLLVDLPGLKALVTSRAALRLSGEHIVVVAPLAVPGSTTVLPATQLMQYAAVRLFVERAQAVAQRFRLTDANAAAVAAICARLDGLPLAIELAAARIKLLPPQALLRRLSSRLKLLIGGARDLHERQQTIRSTIDWSYELLDAGEQALFARLGVFVGGCTLEAAEAVASEGKSQKPKGKTAESQSLVPCTFYLLPLLESLVNQSLVRQEEGIDGEPRFVMLETVREYALERLAASGEEDAVRRRHAAYFQALAGAAEPYLASPKRGAWLEQLKMAHDNLRAVLVWSQVKQDGGASELQLAGRLWWFWFFHGYASEGLSYLEDALERSKALELLPERAKALCGAGALYWFQGNQAIARARLEESVALFRQHGDQQGLAYALTYLGLAIQYQFDFDAAQTVQEESVAIFRALGDRWGLALALGHLAEVPYYRQDFAPAHTLLDESQAIWRALGDRWGLAWCLATLGFVVSDQGDNMLAQQLFEESVPMLRAERHRLRLAASLNKQGTVLHCLGDIQRAITCYEESLALFRELGSQIGIAAPLHNLGFVALQRGDEAHAATYLAEGLEIAHLLSDQEEIEVCLAGLAGVAGARGHFERAARLSGAVEALHTANGEALHPANRAIYARSIAAVRAQMDEAAFAVAWAVGRALPMEQAIAEALEQTPPDSPSSAIC